MKEKKVLKEIVSEILYTLGVEKTFPTMIQIPEAIRKINKLL